MMYEEVVNYKKNRLLRLKQNELEATQVQNGQNHHNQQNSQSTISAPNTTSSSQPQ